MTICKALEPVVSVKQKVCCQTDSSSFIPWFIHVSAKCNFFIYLFCYILIQDEISRVLLRILQACGKATEFLSTIVMDEVNNLGE